MEDALAAISARPALHEWIATEGWGSRFDRITRLRGNDYANERSIRDVEWIDIEGAGELIVTASVQGTRRKPYETSVVLRESRGLWTVESECTCPVGSYCKHAVALLQLLRTKIAEPPPSPAPPVSKTALEPGLASWLEELEAAATPDDANDAVKSAETRFLAYCIERAPETAPHEFEFILRVGNRLKDGTIRILGGQASADPAKPARYMTRDDLMLVTLYRQRHHRHRTWNEVPLEGLGWSELLDGALKTGRLFFGTPGDAYRGSSAYQALKAGEALPVSVAWESQPDGGAKPVVSGVGPELSLLATMPPRYLDLEQGLTGLLRSPVPGPVLAAWLRGPVIPSERVKDVIGRLGSMPALALPLPLALETVERPAVSPRPHLRVHRHVFADAWQRKEVILGELSFTYGDSPRLHPLEQGDPQQHAAVVNGQRIVWPRDLQAERSAEGRLASVGLVPVLRSIPKKLVDARTRHSVIAARPFPTHEAAWVEILQHPYLEELKQEGWVIETDANAGVRSRQVVEFLPQIEADADHGIDWFRFDVSYELDGKRFSLIPVIAEAIASGFTTEAATSGFITIRCEDPADGFIRFPAKELMEIVEQVRHLFQGRTGSGPIRLDRMEAAAVADGLEIDSSDTSRVLSRLGKNLREITALPELAVPDTVQAELRPYQQQGFRWLQFLTEHGLNGILADDMGLGKTLQTLAHLAAEHAKQPGKPSLVIAPTSVVPNWAAEAAKFVPDMPVVMLHGPQRHEAIDRIPEAAVVFTSYPLLSRDFALLSQQEWHLVVLDEAQHIKNPKAAVAVNACKLKAAHRLCLSGTPMENHLGELWGLMRFLMPGFLGDEKSFNTRVRKAIERERSQDAQAALKKRVGPLILRRTKDEVAKELPEKTEIIHGIELSKRQTDLYETVRASMDKRVREAIEERGLAKSHIIVLDALLKLRQICCHPQLLKVEAARRVVESAKLEYLKDELLPTLLEDGRRILIFSQFTSMLGLIQEHLEREGIRHLKLTGQTKDRAAMVKEFQSGEVPVFLISLKAGGTGLNLTAADTVIHYDPWWNPAAENQATDRAHRIGQMKPVFVHKLVCRGTIEERILELQKHKAALVEALLSDDTSKLTIDAATLSHLLEPLG
ncbi:DEAD/DEAH box helicase [Luteolibacter luteus]|uniref:DEAD/DEAH box helicase n=1 Tax=Luteolibacter luteus TaxID=2728835 RepID=A0A858RJ45_9BACT|nr:DEAD/DEAH box helicase [Luteolibacter luteus]QJE96439.1 DEAD/DEAH box helicase [Luteolibacter luteus]